MIQIQDLSKQFGTKQVLNHISIDFEAGKVYGIVGENGAGKTTLFKCITGIEPHEGLIQSSIKPLKDHIGFLTTEPHFFQKITGREYIQLLCNARKISPGNIDERNIFNLPLDQYASSYSTGMKKKLAFSAILLQHNEVFILDEPFNGVDIQSNLLITDIIQTLKSMNKTILISSHIFATLRETCDEIHLLDEGRFTKKVYQDEFNQLEEEMRAFNVGDKIERLKLG